MNPTGKIKIPNFFLMNDWEIKRFLSVVLAIQFTLLVLICAETLGFKIPIMRQLLGFIYLTFIPGFLILRILRIHELGSVESLLYAVGLSLSSLMFLGLFVNTIYSLIGISRPISLLPIAATMAVFVLLLCLFSYFRDKKFAKNCNINIGEIISPSVISLCLLPLIAIFGAYFVNLYGNNILLMILLLIIGVLPFLAVLGLFKVWLYPLALFTMALSLLYHKSLISNHVWGWDINLEYFFSKQVILNGFWDYSLYGNINGMLAIVMIAPIYSMICDVNVVWVFKVFYPFFFALLPLAMYIMFQKLTDTRTSFLACCFFIFASFFYSTMLQLARQQIAELFLGLMFCATVNEKTKNRIIPILFALSIIFSHYGTAYLLMFIFIATYSLIQLYYMVLFREKILSGLKIRPTFDLFFIIMFYTVTLTWYASVAGSNPFITLVNSVNVIAMEFINPLRSDAFWLIVRETASPLHEVSRLLYLTANFLIVAGIIGILLRRDSRFKGEILAFSLIFFFIWIASLLLPYYGFDFTRVYHLTLMLLSPMFVIGGFFIAEILQRISRKKLVFKKGTILGFFSSFLCIFLLFNSGWIYEVAKDYPTSIALSEVDYPVFKDSEVTGAKWLHEFKSEDGKIYADDHRWLLIIGFEGYLITSGCPYTFQKFYQSKPGEFYAFLGEFNVKTGKVLKSITVGPRVFQKVYEDYECENLNRLYNSEKVHVLLK